MYALKSLSTLLLFVAVALSVPVALPEAATDNLVARNEDVMLRSFGNGGGGQQSGYRRDGFGKPSGDRRDFGKPSGDRREWETSGDRRDVQDLVQ